MLKANVLRLKLRQKNIGTLDVIEAAIKRITGAAASVAARQTTLRLNVDKVSTKSKNDILALLQDQGFTVEVNKDEKEKDRWWFELDWSNPPEEPELD